VKKNQNQGSRSRRQRMNFNAGDGGAPEYVIGHEADEMADAARRFQNVAAVEAKSSLAFLWQSAKPSSVL
jgi:hypothetical protein